MAYRIPRGRKWGGSRILVDRGTVLSSVCWIKGQIEFLLDQLYVNLPSGTPQPQPHFHTIYKL